MKPNKIFGSLIPSSPMLVACACGCGVARPMLNQWGRPRRYLRGHNQKNMATHSTAKGGRYVQLNGYVMIRTADHPRSSNGYVFEHILVAEKAIGRYLEAAHPVHHVNEIKSDNSNSNLVICEDNAYHMLLHQRQRVLDRGGNPDTDKRCFKCDAVKSKSEFVRSSNSRDGLHGYCRPCDSSTRKLRG